MDTVSSITPGRFQILIGRIIVLVILIVYNVLVSLTPLIAGLAFLAFVALIPFLVWRGIRFSARVTSYRNLRFDFTGRYGGALRAFVIGPFLAFLTLGILAPLASRWHYTYLFDNLRYGGKRFLSDPRIGDLYRVWFVPALLMAAFYVIVPLALVFLARGGDWFVDSEWTGNELSIQVLIFLVMFGLVITSGVCGIIYTVGARNVALNATWFERKHELRSNLGRRRYLWIAATNLVATLATFGLLRPWAAVRLTRYVAGQTGLLAVGDFGEYVAGLEEESGVVGAEFMDIEGFDVGF